MNLNKRNYPPEHGIRLPTGQMKDLIIALFEKVGMPRQDADLLGQILATNDQRCLFSHGTRQAPNYLQKIKEGAVNPRPQISQVSEAPAALVMDGDGGLGYFPCYQGTQKIIAKAKEGGVAALTTRIPPALRRRQQLYPIGTGPRLHCSVHFGARSAAQTGRFNF